MAKEENLIEWTESDEVLRRRYLEALQAGLTGREAQVFAESNRDIGELRKCVAGRCSPKLIARIVL